MDSWTDRYIHRRFLILFYFLLLTLGVSPLLEAFALRGAIIEILLGLNLLVAVVGTAHVWRVTAFLLAAAGLRFGGMLFDQPGMTTVSTAIWVALVLIAARRSLAYSLRARKVDAEHVYAALSTYLLVGLCFAVVYWMVQGLLPGQFSIHGELAPTGGVSLFRCVYFSFTTLTTLGYGDVVPRSDLTRGLAILEALGGQLYIAVMVARLVSLYVQARPENDGAKPPAA